MHVVHHQPELCTTSLHCIPWSTRETSVQIRSEVVHMTISHVRYQLPPRWCTMQSFHSRCVSHVAHKPLANSILPYYLVDSTLFCRFYPHLFVGFREVNQTKITFFVKTTLWMPHVSMYFFPLLLKMVTRVAQVITESIYTESLHALKQFLLNFYCLGMDLPGIRIGIGIRDFKLDL